MKKKLLVGLAVGMMSVGMAGGASAMIVTPTNDGGSLVNSILGTGINLVSGTVNYSGANDGASGTFTNGGNIGIESGILLTTGDAAGAVGPNNSSSFSGGGATSSLGFSFTTDGGDLFFNYMFASEEYNEYVNSSFNDSFSLLLDGVNIALLPDAATPVTINNVNLGSNSAYFRDNTNGLFDTQYDGLTTVLTAQALGLTAGVHTILFSISDVGDDAWDSGVFIQGSSFSDTPTTAPVPEPATMLLIGTGLAGLVGARRKKKA